MRTFIYVDAFNLYYGSLRGTAYKWLNLETLCRHLLPTHDVQRIKYFTAHVGARLNDPNQPVRQQLYLRALGTLPTVSVHLGHYLSHEVSMPLVVPPTSGSRFVRVIKTEEKGSDVNLATHLISDGYENRYDSAVLITNDDLLGPVQLVADRLKKQVGILNPQKHPAFVLKNAAHFFKQIRRGVLEESQFEATLSDATGTFHKPQGW